MPTHLRSADPHAVREQLPEPALVFALQHERYAIAAVHVSGLADCSPIRTVPGATPAILGLTEWRGNLLTVVDLPQLLGQPAAPGPYCLLRLAPPLELIAFRLPATVRIVPFDSGRGSAAPGEDSADDETRPFRWIVPNELVGRPETERPERR